MHSEHNTDRSADRPLRLLMVFLPRALAVLVLLLVATGTVTAMMLTRGHNEKRPPSASAIVVDSIQTAHHPTDRVWSGYGTARTMVSADLVAEVSGRVVQRPDSIEPGRAVERGDLIVRLDDTDSLNALDSARQALRSLESQLGGLRVEEEQMQLRVGYATDEIQAAQRDLARVDEAIAKGAGSRGERDVKLTALLRAQRDLSSLQQQLDLIPSRRARLEAELSAQRASERIAQDNVDRATMTAPFKGVLQSVGPRVGDWVATGTTVARVVGMTRLEIPLKIASSASSWVRPGDQARLWIRDPGGQPDRIGQVTRIAPEADPASRTMTVFVEVTQDADDPARLLPGQFVHGRVVTSDPHQRVVLPRRAVQSDHVFVAGPLKDGIRRIERAEVRVAYSFETDRPDLDPTETQWVALEIGHEPPEGSQVVISLLDQLVEGMKVRLSSDPPLPAASDEPAQPEDQPENQPANQPETSPDPAPGAVNGPGDGGSP